MARKGLSAALALVYFTTQCALAHVPGVAFWGERRRQTEAFRRKAQGTVHTAFTNPLPPFVRIENLSLYHANVKSYGQAAPMGDETKSRLAALQMKLDSDKSQTFNSALLEFDRRVQEYGAGLAIMFTFWRARSRGGRKWFPHFCPPTAA